jgi:hypothetical protein
MMVAMTAYHEAVHRYQLTALGRRRDEDPRRDESEAGNLALRYVYLHWWEPRKRPPPDVVDALIPDWGRR